jgi:DNA polymerase III subunit epsilon
MKPENPRKIILNIEATGASVDDGHRIIELAAVEMIDGRFTYRVYRTLLNPEHPIDEGAQAIHGISNDALEGAPSFDEIATELSEFLRGAELIVHNKPFHIAFLDMEFEQAGMPPSRQLCTGVIDTLVLARRLRPKKTNNLDALIKHYAIQMPTRTLASTELDAHLIGLIYLELQKRTLH